MSPVDMTAPALIILALAGLVGGWVGWQLRGWKDNRGRKPDVVDGA